MCAARVDVRGVFSHAVLRAGVAGCPACRQLEPVWEELARALHPDIRVGRVSWEVGGAASGRGRHRRTVLQVLCAASGTSSGVRSDGRPCEDGARPLRCLFSPRSPPARAWLILQIDATKNSVLVRRFSVPHFPALYHVSGRETREVPTHYRTLGQLKHFAHVEWADAPLRAACSSPADRCGRLLGGITTLPARGRAMYSHLHYDLHYQPLTIVAGTFLIPVAMGEHHGRARGDAQHGCVWGEGEGGGGWGREGRGTGGTGAPATLMACCPLLRAWMRHGSWRLTPLHNPALFHVQAC